MTSPDIILIGASVRSLAQSAVRDGLTPFCVDFFADADLQQIAGQRHVRVLKEPTDVIPMTEHLAPAVPCLLIGGLETNGDLYSALASVRPVLNSSADSIAAVRDPNRLFTALTGAGLDVLPWQTKPPSSACGET